MIIDRGFYCGRKLIPESLARADRERKRNDWLAERECGSLLFLSLRFFLLFLTHTESKREKTDTKQRKPPPPSLPSPLSLHSPPPFSLSSHSLSPLIGDWFSSPRSISPLLTIDARR